MKAKLMVFFRKAGLKNIAILSSGVFLAQVINFLVQPIAARLFEKSDFGIMTLITSLVSMFSPLATLQYHMSIVNASDDEEADAVTKLSFSILAVASVIFAVGLIVYNCVFPEAYASAGYWIYFSILFFVLAGLVNIIESYNNRYKEYKVMSVRALYRAVIAGVIKLVTGFLHVGFPGLVVAQLAGTVCGLKKQATRLIQNRHQVMAVTKEKLAAVAKKHSRQPLFSLPGIFISGFAYSVLPSFINPLYGLEELGIYSLSMNMLGLPLTLVTNNVARVFFQNASTEKAKTGKFDVSFKNTSLLLIAISVVGFTILWFIAEPAFKLVFGAEWEKSGTYTKLLIPLYSVRFVVSALMYGFIISGKQLLKCILQCLFLIEAFVIYALAQAYSFTIETFLSSISWVYAANYLILFVVLYFTSRKQEPVESAKA